MKYFIKEKIFENNYMRGRIILDYAEKNGLLKVIRERLEKELENAMVIEKNGQERKILDLETYIEDLVKKAKIIINQPDFCSWDHIPSKISDNELMNMNLDILYGIFHHEIIRKIVPDNVIYVFDKDDKNKGKGEVYTYKGFIKKMFWDKFRIIEGELSRFVKKPVYSGDIEYVEGSLKIEICREPHPDEGCC